MNDDAFFRWLLIGICGVFMPIGLFYRLRSHTGEPIDRMQEGLWILIGLRLSALAVLAAGLAWMIHPPWMAWASLPLPFWLRAVGGVLAVSGCGLWVWAVHTLGKNLTDTVVTRQSHTLVQAGPYRWVRHPFYTACAVSMLGGSLMMANWFVPTMTAVVWFCFLVPRTAIEERNLVERFGDSYQAYMRQTGRFLPRMRS